MKLKSIIGVLICSAFVAGCGGHHGVLPAAKPKAAHVSPSAGPMGENADAMRAPTRQDALVSEGGKLRTFAQAAHLALKTKADYGRFVDASIVGAARDHAIDLLKLMPPGMRGDYVEIHPDGTITSNRSDLPAMVKIRHVIGASPRAPRPRAMTAGAQIAPMAYPPQSCSGGPCIRLYSTQNINAAYGVVTPPCDLKLNGYNRDAGDMYFNAYDANGSDVTDAGVGDDEYPDREADPSHPTQIFSFVQSPQSAVAGSPGWDPHTQYNSYTNAYEWWTCGQPLAMMYGTLPFPKYEYPYNGHWYGESMLAVGPPDYDPAQWKLPPATVTLQNPAWTFFYTPLGLDSGPSTYDGIPSNCGGCSTAVMVTIAEPNGVPDGSCYGVCKSSGGLSSPDATWSNVVMGELVDPCGPSTFGLNNPCTLEYASSGGWFSGSYACSPACGAAWYGTSDGTNQDIVAGLADSAYGPGSTNSLAVQTANLPVAPSSACTPDSQGYCYALKGVTVSGYCDGGYRYVNGRQMPLLIKAFNRTYYIFKKQTMLELQETATKDESIPDSAPCTPTYSWTPNDPAVTYNDSSLP